eukprot:240266-Chlamydomonas_euryale.AAC.1
MDDHMNVFGLAYGIGEEESVWAARREEFEGTLFPGPTAALSERGCAVLPWDVKCQVLWGVARPAGVLERCDEACAALVAAALQDDSIMPLARYREAHDAVCAFRRLPRAAALAAAERDARALLLGRVQGAIAEALAKFTAEVTVHVRAHGYSVWSG